MHFFHSPTYRHTCKYVCVPTHVHTHTSTPNHCTLDKNNPPKNKWGVGGLVDLACHLAALGLLVIGHTFRSIESNYYWYSSQKPGIFKHDKNKYSSKSTMELLTDLADWLFVVSTWGQTPTSAVLRIWRILEDFIRFHIVLFKMFFQF